MKTNVIVKSCFFILIAINLTNCGQVLKEVAKEDILGIYKGTDKTITHLSKFNIGLEDQETVEETSISIVKKTDGTVCIVTPDGNIRISAIQLATNGTAFNIPEQNLKYNNQSFTIKGLNGCTVGDMRCDGVYYSTTHELQFSYEGSLPMVEQGVEYNVPFSISCVLKKQ